MLRISCYFAAWEAIDCVKCVFEYTVGDGAGNTVEETVVSDIAVFVLKTDVKLQPTVDENSSILSLIRMC